MQRTKPVSSKIHLNGTDIKLSHIVHNLAVSLWQDCFFKTMHLSAEYATWNSKCLLNRVSRILWNHHYQSLPFQRCHPNPELCFRTAKVNRLVTTVMSSFFSDSQKHLNRLQTVIKTAAWLHTCIGSQLNKGPIWKCITLLNLSNSSGPEHISDLLQPYTSSFLEPHVSTHTLKHNVIFHSKVSLCPLFPVILRTYLFSFHSFNSSFCKGFQISPTLPPHQMVIKRLTVCVHV